MPAAIQNSVPQGVFPWAAGLAGFSRGDTWNVLRNIYKDGSVQRDLIAATSRKRWQMDLLLESTPMQTLWDFYTARFGALETFSFYDLWFTVPLYTYDQSGVETDGRFTVRFASQLQTQTQPRGTLVSFVLVEVT